MTKKVIKKTRDNRFYEEDGYKKQSLNSIRQEKNKKKTKNFSALLKSKNIDRLIDMDDE